MAKDSTGTILLLGGAALAFYGYTQGWFNQLLTQMGLPLPSGGGSTGSGLVMPTAAQFATLQAAGMTAAQVASIQAGGGMQASALTALLTQAAAIIAGQQSAVPPGSPAQQVTPPPSGPAPVPALGTPVTSASQALAQVAANDAFILPDPVTAAALQGALPGGYNWIQTSDKGIVFLRPDVYAAASKLLTNRIQRAAGASPASQQAASQISLGDIQTMMSTQGLSGWNDFRRHMYTRTGRVA